MTTDCATVRDSRIELRRYALGEEIANAITHGVGACLSIAALVILVVRAARYAPPGATGGYVVGYAIFGSAAILLYLTSTLYHSLPHSRAKQVFSSLDHSAIFLLIAGTYTAYALGPLRGGLGWWVFGTIWALATVGIVAYSVYGSAARKFTFFLYLVMGWYGILVADRLYESTTAISWRFLLLGGVLYTIGCVFFVMKNVRWMHSIWHLFVLAGTIMHFFSLLWAI